MVTTLYTELVWTRTPAGWLIKMCISVLLSTLGSPATCDPQPAGLRMLPLHGTVVSCLGEITDSELLNTMETIGDKCQPFEPLGVQKIISHSIKYIKTQLAILIETYKLWIPNFLLLLLCYY